MDEILDDSLLVKQRVYGTFWERTGAYLLDCVLLAIFTFPLNLYNMLVWKDFSIYLVITLLAVIYRPFFEYNYGATPGKMALRLRVVNYSFQKINLKEAILRNLIYILIGLAAVPFTYEVFNTSGFEEATDFANFGIFMSNFPRANDVNYVLCMFIIVDIICLLTDKQRRTLHDRLGKTLVVKKSSADIE